MTRLVANKALSSLSAKPPCRSAISIAGVTNTTPDAARANAAIQLAREGGAEVDVLLAEPCVNACGDERVEQLSRRVIPVGPRAAEEEIALPVRPQVVVSDGLPHFAQELPLSRCVGDCRPRLSETATPADAAVGAPLPGSADRPCAERQPGPG